MKKWLNFKKIGVWARENAKGTDCSKKCAECLKTWHKLDTEGHGNRYLHMIEAEDAPPCGDQYNYICDDCYQIAPNEYKCCTCKMVFEKDPTWSEADARQQAEEINQVKFDEALFQIQCEDCYNFETINN